MTNISIYDTDAQKLEKVAEDNDITVAEIIEQFMESLEEVKDWNNWR